MSTTTTHTNGTTDNAGVPPVPPEAHQRAGGEWVQIEQMELKRYCLSGEFFISRGALGLLSDQGLELHEVLARLNGLGGSIAVGEIRQIDEHLQARFGFDESKPNGACFFVEIDLIPQPAGLTEIFGEPIHVYTRAQAIEDGVLVDVTTTAREAGFRVPVALSHAVWADCVAWGEADTKRQTYQDEAGRLWDVVWMAAIAARHAAAAGHVERLFTILRVPRGGRGRRPRKVLLKAVCGPGDSGEPVVTILLPTED